MQQNRTTVAVHLKSGIHLHAIDQPVAPLAMPKVFTGETIVSCRMRRWMAAALLAGLAATVVASVADAQPTWPDNIPTMQQVHDQLAVMKAQGLECEYVQDRAMDAIIATLADQANADEPLRHHPAWEADMQPAGLNNCGLLTLVQATTTTSYATQTEFNALQTQVNTIAQQVTAIQQQLAATPSPPPPTPPPAPPAAPVLVSSTTAAAYDNPNTTLATAPPIAVTAGNLLVVECGAQGNGTPPPQATKVTDTAGNTFLPAETQQGAAGGTYGQPFVGIWYAANALASSGDTVTCNYNGTGSVDGVVALQYSGVTKLDATAVGTGIGTAFATAPFTTTSANEVVVVAGLNAAGSGSPYVAGAGYTMEKGTYTYYAVEDQITTTALSNATATMNEPDSASWVIVAASFK